MKMKLVVFKEYKKNANGKLKSELYGILKSELDPVELKKAQDDATAPIDAVHFGIPPRAELCEEVELEETVFYENLFTSKGIRAWDNYGRTWCNSGCQVDHLWIRDPEWDKTQENKNE